MQDQRHQRVFVIQRVSDGLYYHAPKGAHSPLWTKDLWRANFIAPTKAKSTIRAVWGRDMEDYVVREVVPMLIEDRRDET